MARHCVIVDIVKPESLAEKAGIRPGDLLLSYEGQPLLSPTFLRALEENTFGVDTVTLCGERGGQPLEFHLPPGRMGVWTRFELPDTILAGYGRGLVAFQANDYVTALKEWGEAAPVVPDTAVRAWLYFHAGDAAYNAFQWQSGQLYCELGQSYCVQAEALGQNGLDSTLVVVVWYYLGMYAEALGDLDAAQEWLEKARQADEAAVRPVWAAENLNKLGSVADLRGDAMAAHDYHSRALAVYERFNPESLDVGRMLNNLGDLAIDRSDLEEALDYHTRALTIWQRLAPDSLYERAGLNGLGRIALMQGRLMEAHEYFARCLEICQRLAPHSDDTSGSLNNLGYVCECEGNLSAARDYYLQALALWEDIIPDSRFVAVALNALGRVLLLLGELETAYAHQTRALEISERIAPRCLESTEILNDLGTTAGKRGDLDAAQAYHIQALEICRAHAPRSVHAAYSLAHLGRIAIARGCLSDAQNYYSEAHTLWGQLAPGGLYHAGTVEGLGWVALKQNNALEASDLFRQAVEIVEGQRAQIAAPEARALLLAQHLRKYAGLLQSYLALGDVAQAFGTVERGRARAFAELLAARSLDRAAADAPPELVEAQQELDRQREQLYGRLNGLADTAADTETVETLHRALRELERKQQDLTAQIRAASPHYAALQYPQPVALAEAQAALEPGTLLLSYFVDDAQTFLFAVSRTHAEAHCLPIGREVLQAQVRTFRQALNRDWVLHDTVKETAQARALYTQLVRPAQAAVRRAERLLLCLDGPLHTLPFAALVTNPRGAAKHLGAQKPLVHTLSATLHASTNHASARAPAKPARIHPPRAVPRLLAFGDPWYGTSQRMEHPSGELALLQTRGLSLSPLPHTRIEVESLARLYEPNAAVRLGAKATKSAVLRESGGADLLHFACHAWFDPQLPLSSGLILSQPDVLAELAPDGDNGLLQAWEILHKLTLTADLVVLSACQSGLGAEVRGEGLVGLTRAFQYAGAKSLVVSLWDINDASTALFMAAFYGALQSRAGKDEALQQGIAALQAEPRWNAPYYWGAFVLIGDRA